MSRKLTFALEMVRLFKWGSERLRIEPVLLSVFFGKVRVHNSGQLSETTVATAGVTLKLQCPRSRTCKVDIKIELSHREIPMLETGAIQGRRGALLRRLKFFREAAVGNVSCVGLLNSERRGQFFRRLSQMSSKLSSETAVGNATSRN